MNLNCGTRRSPTVQPTGCSWGTLFQDGPNLLWLYRALIRVLSTPWLPSYTPAVPAGRRAPSPSPAATLSSWGEAPITAQRLEPGSKSQHLPGLYNPGGRGLRGGALGTGSGQGQPPSRAFSPSGGSTVSSRYVQVLGFKTQSSCPALKPHLFLGTTSFGLCASTEHHSSPRVR